MDQIAEPSSVEMVYNGSYIQVVTDGNVLEIAAYDMSGRMVSRSAAGERVLRMCNSEMASGVYIIKAVTTAGSAVERLIIN